MPSTTNNSFGARRGKWLDQVHDDPEMTDAFCRVMYAVTRCLDRETFTAKHGDIAIAKRAHKSASTVERAMKAAEKRGHLQIKRPSRRKPREITPILIGESRQIDGTESRHESRQPERGPPVESKGCAPISQDSHKYKKEEDLKNGNSRGPRGPEKEKPFSSDSPKPSLRSACEVPRPTTVLPPEFQKWLGGLPRMPRPRLWDHRQEDSETLERYRRAANAGGATMAVSS